MAATSHCSLITATTVGRSLYLLTAEGECVWTKSGDNCLDHEGWSTSISSDGTTIAVGTANKNPSEGSIYIFNTQGELLFTKTLGAPVWSVSLSQDGSVVAAACWDGKAYRFNRTRDEYKLTITFAAKTTSGLYGIRLNKAGEGAILCAYDTALIVLDSQWKEIARKECLSGLYNVALSETNHLAIAGQRDGSLLLFYPHSGNSEIIQVLGCVRPICGVAASAEADLFVCGSFDGWAYLVNRHGLPLGCVETDGEVWSAACSDDAALICIGSGDHSVRLIDNTCSVAPIREILHLESSIETGRSETEANVARLILLYGQYGVFEYGYNRLKTLLKSAPSPTLYRKTSHQLLRNALSTSRGNHWAHYELGLIDQDANRHHDAIPHFQNAAQEPKYASRAMTRCADSFAALKLTTATASCYRRAREQQIDSDAKRVLYNLGRSYEDAKQWHEAISHYQLLASWDAGYRNTWKRLESLVSAHLTTNPETTPPKADYTGITISLLGPDALRDVDESLKHVLKARTAEVLMQPDERKKVSDIIHKLRGNERFCRGITGAGLDYTQELFLKYDYALPEDETKKFLETVNLLFLVGDLQLKATLDIGSATGRYPMLMQWLGSEAYGIDIERRAVEYSNKNSQVDGWPKYEVCDARTLTFKQPTFNLVTCMMGTFAHIEQGDQERVASQIFNSLVPGGCVAISTWDMECSHLAFLSIYNETQKNTIRRNSPTIHSMRETFKNVGFENIQVRSFCMLPQIVLYDLGLENLRSGDIKLIAQADLAVHSLYPNKHGEMFLAFARKPN